MATSSTSNTPFTISLQGWDTANAVGFDVINASIKSQDKTPARFSTFANDPVLFGTWAPWQLIPGGVDRLLQMQCPIATGTAGFDLCVLDTSINATGLQYSADALTMTDQAMFRRSVLAYGKFPLSSGKFYFETTLKVGPAASVGVALDNSVLIDVNPNAFFYSSDGGLKSGATKIPTTASTWQNVGDTVGVAIDLDARKIWFRAPDGTWQGANADPILGIGETFSLPAGNLFPYFGVLMSASMTVNFGQSTFKHPVPTGFTAGWPKTILALDGFSPKIKVQLEQFANSAKTTDFKVDSIGKNLLPAVTVDSVNPTSGSPITKAQENIVKIALEDWLNANITAFGNIFHTVNLNSALATGDLAWMAPVTADYAVADVPGSTPPKSVFAVLALTADRPGTVTRTAPKSLAASIDPNIIANIPQGSNSVFAISAERFTSQVLFEGAKKIMVGSTSNDFDIDPTGLVIKSNKSLPWRQVTLDDKTVVTPTVPAGGLTMRIVGGTIEVEFKGVTFAHPLAVLAGNNVITMNITQILYLVLQKRTDGKHILNVQNQDPNLKNPPAGDPLNYKDFSFSCSLDGTALSSQAAMLWATVGVSIFTVGCAAFSALGKWVLNSRAAAQTIANGLQGGTQTMELQAVFNQIMYGAANVTEGAGCLATGGACGAGTLPVLTKMALGGAILGALGVITPAVLLAKTYEDLGCGDVDKFKSSLTFETYFDQILANFVWPDTATWTLQEVQLAESLLIYGKLS